MTYADINKMFTAEVSKYLALGYHFNTSTMNASEGELGKVDLGGGGTVAKYVAYHNIPTIDIGVPVLSMHSPFEVVSKADVYMAYKAFEAFIRQ